MEGNSINNRDFLKFIIFIRGCQCDCLPQAPGTLLCYCLYRAPDLLPYDFNTFRLLKKAPKGCSFMSHNVVQEDALQRFNSSRNSLQTEYTGRCMDGTPV